MFSQRQSGIGQGNDAGRDHHNEGECCNDTLVLPGPMCDPRSGVHMECYHTAIVLHVAKVGWMWRVHEVGCNPGEHWATSRANLCTGNRLLYFLTTQSYFLNM